MRSCFASNGAKLLFHGRRQNVNMSDRSCNVSGQFLSVDGAASRTKSSLVLTLALPD